MLANLKTLLSLTYTQHSEGEKQIRAAGLKSEFYKNKQVTDVPLIFLCRNITFNKWLKSFFIQNILQ